MNNLVATMALLRLDFESAQTYLEIAVRNNPDHRIRQRGGWKPAHTQVGQLLQEYSLDSASLARLHEGLVGTNPTAALARLVLDVPDYTPAAMHLMIALRQKGLLAVLSHSRQKSALIIPKRIAQYWDADSREDIEESCETWRAMHSTYLYRRYSMNEARQFIQEMGLNGALEAFERVNERGMRQDLFGLAVLLKEGGFFINAADRCLAPLYTIDIGACDLMLYQAEFGAVGNRFIGARPNHPAIALALLALIKAVNRGDKEMMWLSSGPGLLTRSVAHYIAANLEDHLAISLIYDQYELNEFVGIHGPLPPANRIRTASSVIRR